MLEKWQLLVSQYEAFEGLPFEERAQACVAVDDELRLFLTALERETRETKLSVLAAICASPYCYRALDQARPPTAVAYTLISKGLYEEGMCETPNRFREEVEYLTDGLEEVEVPGGVERHRLAVLQNPHIDPMILEDEFDSSDGSAFEIVDAVLSNPVAPERLLRRIFEGSFYGVDDYDAFDVLPALIKHPSTPRDVLERIIAGDHPWEMDEDEDTFEEIARPAQARLQAWQ